VFDEMQKLKNPGALVTKASKALNCEFKVGLTGTPVENRLADLHSLVDILRPGYLGKLSDFSIEYENTVNQEEKLLKLKSKVEEEDNGLPALMLRRMKKDVLVDGTLLGKEIISAPDLNSMKEIMPAIQSNNYNVVINLYKNNIDKKNMFKALQGLRNISLCYQDPDICGVSLQEIFDNSARLKKTINILDEIKNKNEKALVFCESRKVQLILQTYIQARFGFKPDIINGQTHVVKRQEYVNKFEKGPEGFNIIILSPKAAGTGFTLIAANHVIHLSRWWNPATEDQATDRAYRIGQKKKVYVYYPLAIHPNFGDDSFDIKLNSLIERKRSLSDKLLLPINPLNDDFEGLNNVEELYNGTFNRK
jgi:SNF2 family DNA or RNA helicase